MKATIGKLLLLIDNKAIKKLVILLLMMILAAILETVGIGLVVPLVGIIASPTIIHEQAILASIYEFLNFKSTTNFLIFSVVLLFSIFFFYYFYLLLFIYSYFIFI